MRANGLAMQFAAWITLWGVTWVALLDATIGVLSFGFVRPDMEWGAAFLREKILGKLEGRR